MNRLHSVLAASFLSLSLSLAAAGPSSSTAAAAGVSPEHAQQLVRSDRFRQLAAELRCLVCQNQSLADSNAELATDLRDEVVRLMAAGNTDSQIKRHLVDRYGDFVLYRPTFAARNWALWAGPFVMLAIGAIVLWRMTRGRAAAPEPQAPLTPEESARIRRILADEPPPPR
jgi:cytochrome c-type biogenesis protein CcmH